MARQIQASRRKQSRGGGWLLTAAVVVLAVGACLLLSPPEPSDLAAVFAKGTPPPSAAVEAVTLPAQSWYLVEDGGEAISASRALLEAEILRESGGELASIRMITTEEVDLRFTASASQLAALHRSAEAVLETFDTLDRMAHLSPYDAVNTAVYATLNLDSLIKSLDTALAGVENPVVRGLAGLAGSCREAMSDLSKDASAERVRKKTAGLALQYASYVQYLTGT